MLKGRALVSEETSTTSGVSSGTTRGLLDRLARLRSVKKEVIDSTIPQSTNHLSRKPQTNDSPRYLPRKPLINASVKSDSLDNVPSNTMPASPTFNRRRLLLNNSGKKQSNPLGVQSPKYFPKQVDVVEEAIREAPVRQPNFTSKEQNNEALAKEREKIEFLQNYLADVIKSKEEVEAELKQLRESERQLQSKVDELESELLAVKAQKSLSITTEESSEIAKLKETIRLLELERSSTQSVCQKAIQVLDSKADPNYEALLKEVDKLRSREQHFKEANEIFQQKLQVLTEENRRLRGLRPNQIF